MGSSSQVQPQARNGLYDCKVLFPVTVQGMQIMNLCVTFELESFSGLVTAFWFGSLSQSVLWLLASLDRNIVNVLCTL